MNKSFYMHIKKYIRLIPFSNHFICWISGLINPIRAKLKFRNTFRKFANESIGVKRFELNWIDRYPCLYDNTSNTNFDRHYIYHPAWAARIIKETNPKVHIDISSSLHFCSLLSAFVPVEFYDYRPANLVLSNLHNGHGNLLKLDFADNSVASLSCMHTIEHVGLGRYGDPIDYDGDIKAMAELSRILAIEGNLLIVVPIGNKSIIQFNAHRIYKKEQVVTQFEKFGLTLKEFTLIPENEVDGGLVLNPSLELLIKQKYGCGCFWFKKNRHKNTFI